MKPDRQPRVLVDGLPFFRNGSNGVARYVANLCRALSAAPDAPRPTLVVPRRCATPPPPDLRAAEERSFRACLAMLRADAFLSTWYRRWPSMRNRPSAVVVYDWIDDEMRLYAPNRGDLPAEQRRALAGAPLAVAISEDVRRKTLERVALPPDRVVVVPPVVAEPFDADPPDENARRLFRERTTGGAPFVLSVGRRASYKNFPAVLRAFLAAAPRTDRHLVLAGGEPRLTDEWIWEIARAGCLGRVHRLGRLSDENLRLAYASADFFVSASRAEGFGLGPVEAVCSGGAAVVSDLPVFRETCDGMARFVPVDAFDAWIDAFAAPSVPAPAGARETLLRRYSPESAAAAFSEGFRRLLD